MTLNRLLEEVYALGFEDAAELNEAFIYSAERAQRLILMEHGNENTGKIIATKLDTASHMELYSHTPGANTSFPIHGVAYSFKVSGKGAFTVTDASGTKITEFNDLMGTHRAFVSGEAVITFCGDFSYSVIDFTVFHSVGGAEASDIPIYSRTKDYRITEYIKDYLAATKIPTDPYGRSIEGATVSGDLLKLPSDYSGEIIIHYKRVPKKISVDNADGEIDIPRSCEHLLPLLTASYIWLDDDPDKAQYYMSIYREEMARIRRYVSSQFDNEYRDVTGWA